MSAGGSRRIEIIVISACEKEDHWEKALALLGELLNASVSRNVISFNAAIFACEKEGRGEQALALLGGC